MVLNMVLNTGVNMVLNIVLKIVLNIVSNTNSSRNINLISSKQFISFSFYTVFLRLVLDFIPRSSFLRVNVSYSNKTSEYSSSEMESSDNAFINETTDGIKC